MAYPNESWGERDRRRRGWTIAVSLVASIILGIAWLAFGVGGNLLVYSLGIAFLLIAGLAVPVVIVGIGVLVIRGLRWIRR
jgi:hypothetical protein